MVKVDTEKTIGQAWKEIVIEEQEQQTFLKK